MDFNSGTELTNAWTSGGILLFFIVEKIVRRYEELSNHGGQRALGHTHHHHQKKDRVKKLEGSEKSTAVGEVSGLDDKELKSLETKNSDIKKVLSDCTEVLCFKRYLSNTNECSMWLHDLLLIWWGSLLLVRLESVSFEFWIG
jgi:hypothetical protein